MLQLSYSDLKARRWDCKTYEDRARGIVQEKAAYDLLGEYSDSQALAVTELSMIKKLHAFRRIGRSYPGYVPLYLCVDLTGWNNKFRHEVVAPIARAYMDRVYDTNLFAKAQKAFEKTFYYAPDEGAVYSWDGQLGGIEGLSTGTWEITFISQVHAVMASLDMPYYILIKGDDLRIALLVPPHVLENQSINEVKDQVLAHLKEGLADFGQAAKTEDSYASKGYFSFSHEASVGTIELPQTARKIQKCMGNNNAILNTLDEKIGAALSNAHSASKVSVCPIACYRVGLLWALYHIRRHSVFQKLPINQYKALLLTPSLVGGFPIVFLHNYY